MKRLVFAIALVTALVAIPTVLAGGNPKAMVLTLADVQSVPDCVAHTCGGANIGFGNMASGFKAGKTKATVKTSKPYGRIRGYEANFRNVTKPDGYSTSTLRFVAISSSADVYTSAAVAEKAWTDRVATYAKNPRYFQAMGSAPGISKQSKLYSTEVLDQSGYFLFWRSGSVLALLSVNKASDITFDGLASAYVKRLAKIQQTRIARASR